MKRISLVLPNASKTIELNDSPTAQALWDTLPVEGRALRWGREIYFTVELDVPPAPDARTEMAVGEVAFWPPGRAFCVFWGATPASRAGEPRAASEVNPIGRLVDSVDGLDVVRDGDPVRLEALESAAE